MSAEETRYYHELLNDKWIAETIFPGLRGGYFVEAGALGGKWGTATYTLETMFGWTGICVEPSEEKFRELALNRKNSKLDDRLLYSASGQIVEFAYFDDRPAYSGITGHLRPDMQQQLSRQQLTHIRQKPTITLYDLLKCHSAPEVIHYLCLDTEGSEPEILRGFPFNRPYKILAVSIEGHQCDKIMLDAGYLQVSNEFHDRSYEAYFLHPEIGSHGGLGSPV